MCFQFPRNKTDDHAKSGMQRHLDLACTRLEQQAKINEEQKMRMMEQERKIVEQGSMLKEAFKTIRTIEQRFAPKRTNTVYEGQLGYVSGDLKAGRMVSSDSFYLKGYKMRIFVKTPAISYLWPSPKEPCVSVGLNVIAGKFDHEVEWPFESRVIVYFPGAVRDMQLQQVKSAFAAPWYKEVPVFLCTPHPSTDPSKEMVTVESSHRLQDLSPPYRFVVKLSN